MPIYKPTELRQFLNALGISPKKGLSQNFLIDGNIVRKIVEASEACPEDLVLEIGPGPGSLTQALLKKGSRVLAVETDKLLAQELMRIQTPDNRLSVLCQDILTFSSTEVLPPLLSENRRVKIVANLPYHLTTPILALFCTQRHFYSSITVMVQEEVARRMTGLPNTKEYGSFTVFLRFYADVSYAFTVSRNCFYPIPKVDSAVAVIRLKTPPLDEKEAELFFKMTRTAFEHRRKMLRASLKPLYDPSTVEACLKEIGKTPEARPEMLSLEEFLELYAALKRASAGETT